MSDIQNITYHMDSLLHNLLWPESSMYRKRIKSQLSVMLLLMKGPWKKTPLPDWTMPFLDYQQNSKEGFFRTIHSSKAERGWRENVTEMMFKFPKDFYQNEIYFAVACFNSVSPHNLGGEISHKKSQIPGIYLSPCVKAIYLLSQ